LAKRHIVRNVLIGIAATIGCVAITVAVIVNTAWFRNFLRNEISNQALAHAGARIEVGAISTHWTRLLFDLNNVVVYGNQNPSANEPPVLRAAHLEVGIQFLPLLHNRLELSKLILDEPVIRIAIDAQGRSNLPNSPHPSTTSTPDTLFDLEIKDCAISSGQIFYNDAEISLDAELHNLKLSTGYSLLTSEYKGSLSYDKGRLTTGTFGPVANAMRVQYVATRSGLSVRPLLLQSGNSRLTLNAKLTNYEQPSIDGTYDGNLSTADLSNILHSTEISIGNVVLNGKLAYAAADQRPFMAAVSVQGQIRSDRLQIRTGQKSVDATSISAAYTLQNGALQIRNLVAGILGGKAQANFQMQHMDAPRTTSQLDASLQGVSLASASDVLASTNAKKLPFSGTTNLKLNAAWSGSIKDAVAHAQLAIASRQQSISAHSIPVNGLVQVDYNGPQDKISFGQSHLETASTRLSIAGTLSSQRGGNSTLTTLATTSDLNEVASVATMLQSAMESSSTPPRIPTLGGSASLTVRATGAARNPNIQGHLTAQNLAIDDTRWQSLAVNVSANSSGISIQNGALTSAGKSQVTFSGKADLHDWSLGPNSAIQAQASVVNTPVETAEEIARLHYPVTGNLSVNVSVSGTKSAPDGKAMLTLARASAWNEPIENLTVNAQSHSGNIESVVNLQVPAGTVSANVSYALESQQYDLKLQANNVKLAEITPLQKRGAVQGTANLTASGAGTIHDPQLEMKLSIPQLQALGQTISAIDAEVNLANQHAGLQLSSQVDKGSVQAKADIALTGNQYTTATLDVRSLPVALVVANFAPTEATKLGGETDIHLTASGPLKSREQMQAQLRIPTLNVTYGQAQIALAHPLLANYSNGTLTVTPTEIQGPGTHLTFGGTVPIKSKAEYSLAADGSIDLNAVQQFVPGVKSSGEVEVHIHSAGQVSKPTMQGQLQVKDAVFSTQSLPLAIEGLNAQINLSGIRIEIAKLSGNAGGGTISAQGFATLGQGNTFNLAVNAQSVRLLYPAGLRSVLTAQLNFRGNTSSSFLTGRVLVDNLSFTQQFDLASFAGDFSEESTGAPPSAFENSLKLNIAVVSSQQISLASSKLSVGGSANLNVVGTLAQPVILGRIALTSGEVFFLGKRFEVQSGTIAFANPVRTEPVVRMYITTAIKQYNITLNLNGPVDRLQTNYTSDPALPPADIIHLLAFGNTNEEAASQPSQSAAMGAESVLAQGVGSQVAGRIENLTGISQLTIDPLATNNSGQPGQQVSIQERVTGSLLFTFSTDVTTTQGQSVELQYDLNRRLSVTLSRDQNGGYGINLRLHKVF
jgi:translocation and assembly module TamB